MKRSRKGEVWIEVAVAASRWRDEDGDGGGSGRAEDEARWSGLARHPDRRRLI